MTAPLIPANRIAAFSGFGGTASAAGYAYRPDSGEDIAEAIEMASRTGRQVVSRGAGRSYGDAGILPEAIVLDMTGMRTILSYDPSTGVIDAQAGVTIEDLWRLGLPDGWWPPVVSGTMFPTLGGALAMNIHGKNAFNAGTLGEHVLELEFMDGFGRSRIVGPADPQFANLISSAGLLGAIVRVRLQMRRISSGDLDVIPVSCRDWDEQFAAFESHAADADYMVAWIDAFGAGKHSGRGQFHAAKYRHDEAETLRLAHQDLPAKIMGVVPKSSVWRILRTLNNRDDMRTLNWLKYASGRIPGAAKPYSQSLVAFSFLLDYVPGWQRAYGLGGFIQFQSFVPKESAKAVFAEQMRMQQALRQESFLAVMKKHRPDRLGFVADPWLFPHALDGYSLALDFKVTDARWPILEVLCQRMSELVLAAGGRFYFAKDSTLRPIDVQRCWGQQRLDRYRAAKAELDPDGIFSSSLARRVGLA